jgi:drug/metabolite transporter (DMT)-like permease
MATTSRGIVDPDLSLDYATTLIAALLIGTGFVLQQHAAELEPDSRFLRVRLITDLLRKPRWLAGIACMVIGQILAAWSIGHLELSLVEPLLATNLLFALVLAVPLSRQAVQFGEVIGAVVLCTGVALLSASRSVTPIGLSFGSFSHWPAAAGIALVAFVLVQAGRIRAGRMRAALTGAGAGLVLGIQDALTRQTLEVLQGSSFTVLFSSWSAYALVGAGAVGLWLMQSAFSAGPLQFSLPAISACEPIAGMGLGIGVFGDRIQVSPGILAMEAAGLAALVGGVILVGRSRVLSGLGNGVGRSPARPGQQPQTQSAQPQTQSAQPQTQTPRPQSQGQTSPGAGEPRSSGAGAPANPATGLPSTARRQVPPEG